MAKKKLGGLGKGLDSLFAELPDISDEPSSSTLITWSTKAYWHK